MPGHRFLFERLYTNTTAPMFGTQSEKTENFFFDFGKYEAEGFKISPYAWEGNDFTWIGEYSLEKTPAIVRDKQQKTVSMGGGNSSTQKLLRSPCNFPWSAMQCWLNLWKQPRLREQTPPCRRTFICLATDVLFLLVKFKKKCIFANGIILNT